MNEQYYSLSLWREEPLLIYYPPWKRLSWKIELIANTTYLTANAWILNIKWLQKK
jgi:hypothetical protein